MPAAHTNALDVEGIAMCLYDDHNFSDLASIEAEINQCLRQYKKANINTTCSSRERVVAKAAPATPIAGTPNPPLISQKFNAILITIVIVPKHKGVTVSPDERRADSETMIRCVSNNTGKLYQR